MNSSFNRRYEINNVGLDIPVEPASDEHRKAWVELRKVSYARENEDYYTECNMANPIENITPEYLEALTKKVHKLDRERTDYIRQWNAKVDANSAKVSSYKVVNGVICPVDEGKGL